MSRHFLAFSSKSTDSTQPKQALLVKRRLKNPFKSFLNCEYCKQTLSTLCRMKSPSVCVEKPLFDVILPHFWSILKFYHKSVSTYLLSSTICPHSVLPHGFKVLVPWLPSPHFVCFICNMRFSILIFILSLGLLPIHNDFRPNQRKMFSQAWSRTDWQTVQLTLNFKILRVARCYRDPNAKVIIASSRSRLPLSTSTAIAPAVEQRSLPRLRRPPLIYWYSHPDCHCTTATLVGSVILTIEANRNCNRESIV